MRSRGLLLMLMPLVVALAGCMASQETRQGADALEDALGTPAWAASVSVRSGLDGQFADQVQTEVVLDDSATAADVAAFVVAMPGQVVDAGLEDVAANKQLTFVSTSRSRLVIEWTAVSSDEVAGVVEEWFDVGAALGQGVEATVRTDGGASYVVTLGDGSRSAVEATYATLAGLSRPGTAWSVLATDGDLSLELSSSVLPTDDELAVWHSMVGALDRLPDDLPASLVSLRLLDRTVAGMTLTAPDDTTKESFTVEAYGDRVWPVVRPQLDAMTSLPGDWSYFANWAPTYAPLQNNLFISVLTDLPVTDNGDEPTRWSRAAKDYVG